VPAYTAAFRLKNCLVKFAAVDYSNQCTKARLVPDVNVQTMRTLVPDGQITDIDSAVWTLELSGVQDHETGGLAAFLLANQGTLQTVIIAPVNTTGKKQATVSVRIMPPPFGGSQGEWSEFDMELPVQGQPTFAAVP
jgi:hypothetical protein